MNVDIGDLVLFVYVIAIVLTGVYLERTFGELGRFVVVAFGGVVALFWTVYFRRYVEHRVVNADGSEGSDPEPETSRHE